MIVDVRCHIHPEMILLQKNPLLKMLSWLHVKIVNPSKNLVWARPSGMNSKTGGARARALNVLNVTQGQSRCDSYLCVIYFFLEIV